MLTVLLVEDHPMNRKLFRDILEMQFQVLEAESAEIALELLQNHSPDLLLVDMQLPGMDGLSLIRLLKADPARAAVPVVGISAHAMRRDIELAREAGCVDYITKPITDDPFTFLERISRSLSAKSQIPNPQSQTSSNPETKAETQAEEGAAAKVGLEIEI
jgi:CheY-like chemotaxis protein